MCQHNDVPQKAAWQVLHDRITETLGRFGMTKNAFGKADYWLVDDNWGPESHQLEFQNLSLLRPEIVKSLQALLADYPEWKINLCAGVSAPRNKWPPADIEIYRDGIVDDLPREFLPAEFRHYTYEGGRSSKKVDPSGTSYIFRRALK